MSDNVPILQSDAQAEQIAIERIRQPWLVLEAERRSPEGFFVAFSGGKDSIVLLDLVRRAGVPHAAYFSVTTVDPPELLRFIRQYYPQTIWRKPAKTMRQLIIEKGGPPGRLSRYCCEHLKETGGEGRVVLLGLRWDESDARGKRRMVESCHKAKIGRMLVSPIIDWTTDRVWRYIRRHRLAYPCLYDEGFDRIGCVACPCAPRRMRSDLERWPRYKAMYLSAFQAAIDRKANPEAYEGPFAKWTTAEAMMEWWLTLGTKDRRQKIEDGQPWLFEG